MELLEASDTAKKMALMRAQYEAVERAKALLNKNKCHRNAVLLQRAERDLKELRGTLMPLRLVA